MSCAGVGPLIRKKIFYPWILDEGNKIQAALLSYFKAQDKTTVHTGIKNKLAQSVGGRYEHVFLNSIRKPRVNVKASALKWAAAHSLLQVRDGYISEEGLDWEM